LDELRVAKGAMLQNRSGIQHLRGNRVFFCQAVVPFGRNWLGIPPRSQPPWPGSITTIENGTSARASAITMNGMTIAAKKVCRTKRVPPLPGQRGNRRKKLTSRFCSSSSSRKAIGISDLFILMAFFNSEGMNNSPEGYGTLAVRPTGRGNDTVPHV
jgi:hypothetical protein